MLKNIIDAKDIDGKDVFRKSFMSSVDTFDPDTRAHAKQYVLEHHYVTELHGKRYLACVKRGNDAMLIETNATGKNIVVVAVMDTSIYSNAIAEGIAQIKHHVHSKRKRVAAKAPEKVATKTKAKK